MDDKSHQWQLYIQLKWRDDSTVTLLNKLAVEVFLEDLRDVIVKYQGEKPGKYQSS